MPVIPRPSMLAQNIVKVKQRGPLWAGPCAEGPLGGVTQSMLGKFLSCRERFRIKYVLGLDPADRWEKSWGYGLMWHECEEALASENVKYGVSVGSTLWQDKLIEHSRAMIEKYPTQIEELEKWWNVCMVQFPEYVKYWREHPDVQNRTPLMQEQVFDVPYQLPSGRVVRLRGKFDSVDLIDGGIWLQENKSKGDIDPESIEKQLTRDLQTMLYLIALKNLDWRKCDKFNAFTGLPLIKGVRYNVIRRPLSGGKGSIQKHKAKCTKETRSKKDNRILKPSVITPAETDAEYYERLRSDYIADDPAYWFFRVKSEISDSDIQKFRDQCLDPILEQLCWWYDEVTGVDLANVIQEFGYPTTNYCLPYGTYNSLVENGATEYDAYLATGSVVGLHQNDTLFKELV